MIILPLLTQNYASIENVKTASFRTENWRFWSEWRDSNSRHPGPKPGALPTGPHPDMKLRESSQRWWVSANGLFNAEYIVHHPGRNCKIKMLFHERIGPQSWDTMGVSGPGRAGGAVSRSRRSPRGGAGGGRRCQRLFQANRFGRS